jgi:hypothetical protein
MLTKLAAGTIESMRSLVAEVVPTCQICGLAIHGHLFKHIASTPVEKKRLEEFRGFLKAVEDVDWNVLLSFQGWDGRLTSADIIGLKCIDGRCSLAVLLCPASLEEPYTLFTQKFVDGCGGPLAEQFFGKV